MIRKWIASLALALFFTATTSAQCGFIINPYLFVSGCSCTPAYVTGDRTATITVTTNGYINFGPTNLVDGAFGANTSDAATNAGGSVTGSDYVRFDFGSGNSILVTEARWYQNVSDGRGDFIWRGSDDASSWTDIGSSFTVGGTTTQTQTELGGNTTGYRYYELRGVSGSASGAGWDTEIEFEQCTC